jgi:hypothetical protein
VTERASRPSPRGSGLPFGLALACLVTALSAQPAQAKVLGLGPVEGVLDLTLAYGLLARTQQAELDFVGLGNGGNGPSVNLDDATLNYDTGLVSNEVRLTADLTLAWRNFGFFIRGFGFYDFESKLSDRERTDLSSDAQSLVGAGGELQEYYLSARFAPGGMPVQVRVGDQVINWGVGSFLRFGADVVNPLDFVSLLRPAAEARDIFVPQGMVWMASNVSELVALEAFYQYDWEPVVLPPVGYFFAGADLNGGDGTNAYFSGAGRFSDQGTNLDDAFGLAPGTLGFDESFMRVPGAGADEPRSQGQYGVTARLILPALNTTSFRIHFMNYHARLPVVSAVTPDQAALDAAAVIGAGSPTDDEKSLAFGMLSNSARYHVSYPEDIRMLGISFDTVLPRTGTLVGMELSHHFNWPVQTPVPVVLETALSPLRSALDGNPAASLGASQAVSGVDDTHKTQLTLELAQRFGPRLWSSQSLLVVNFGWVHFDELSKSHPFDEDSFGYSITVLVDHNGLFGGLNLRPFVAFTHDAKGVTPGPAGAFIEGRKSAAIGVSANYTNRVTADLRYVNFFDGRPLNAQLDRDFFSFSLRFHY